MGFLSKIPGAGLVSKIPGLGKLVASAPAAAAAPAVAATDGSAALVEAGATPEAPAADAAAGKPDLKTALATARKHNNDGEYQQAIDAIKLVAKDKQAAASLELHLEYAIAHTHQGNDAKAIKTLDTLLAHDKASPAVKLDANLHRALLAQKEGKPDDALKFAKAGLKIVQDEDARKVAAAAAAAAPPAAEAEKGKEKGKDKKKAAEPAPAPAPVVKRILPEVKTYKEGSQDDRAMTMLLAAVLCQKRGRRPAEKCFGLQAAYTAAETSEVRKLARGYSELISDDGAGMTALENVAPLLEADKNHPLAKIIDDRGRAKNWADSGLGADDADTPKLKPVKSAAEPAKPKPPAKAKPAAPASTKEGGDGKPAAPPAGTAAPQTGTGDGITAVVAVTEPATAGGTTGGQDLTATVNTAAAGEPGAIELAPAVPGTGFVAGVATTQPAAGDDDAPLPMPTDDPTTPVATVEAAATGDDAPLPMPTDETVTPAGGPAAAAVEAGGEPDINGDEVGKGDRRSGSTIGLEPAGGAPPPPGQG